MKCKPDIFRLVFLVVSLTVATYFSYYFLYVLCTSQYSKICDGNNSLFYFYFLGLLTSTFPSLFIAELISFNIIDIENETIHIKKIFRKNSVCQLQDVISVKHNVIRNTDAYYYKTSDDLFFVVSKHMFKNYKEIKDILNRNMTVEAILFPANFKMVTIIWAILSSINGLLLYFSC